jgi:hypothetical protein
VNEVNVCNVSSYSDSNNVPYPTANLCNNNENAGSVLHVNNIDLSELALPTFRNITSLTSRPTCWMIFLCELN